MDRVFAPLFCDSDLRFVPSLYQAKVWKKSIYFYFKLKQFGILLSIDIVVTIKSFLTQRVMSIGDKTQNGVSFKYGIR